MSNQPKNHQLREVFQGKWGFIFACIGSAVGMGNIWMFPSRVSGFGGGAFLIPYFFFVIVIGQSGLIGEMSLGRGTRSATLGAFDKAVRSRKPDSPLGAIVGCIPTFGSLALALGYTVVVGWILKYTVASFTGALQIPQSVEDFGALFGATAGPWGNNFWQLVGIILVFGVMLAGVADGIERANKIMMPLFFFLFLGLALYIATLPGASEGYRYLFTVDTAMLANPQTWVYALGQAFFSLSLAGNGSVIYGSYLDDQVDVRDSALKISFFDTSAAMLAALVIIPAMATAGQQLTEGGPGLMFIFLPHLFLEMTGGGVFSIIFFVAVFFAGLSSLINLYETPVAATQEWFGFSRKKSVFLVAILAIVVSMSIQAIVSDWMDFVSIYACPLGAGLAGIMFYWVFDKKFVETEVGKGMKKGCPPWVYNLGRYGFCPLTILVFILGIAYGGIG